MINMTVIVLTVTNRVAVDSFQSSPCPCQFLNNLYYKENYHVYQRATETIRYESYDR